MVPVLGDLGTLILLCVLVSMYLFSFLYERFLSGCLEYNNEQYSQSEIAPAATVTTPPPGRRRLVDNGEIVFETFMQENSKEDDGGGCAICLEEYRDGETRAAITECNHSFHAACIKAWLGDSDNCPLCRTHVV